MTQGIIYLNQGDKCMIRIAVSIHSLRKHYDGPVTLIAVDEQKQWFLDILKDMNVDIKKVKNKPKIPPLVRKARLQEYSPYDVTMFIDADTLILQPIDEYFEKIKEYKFCTGEFAGWKTSGGTMSRRIKGFQSVVPEYVKPSLEYGKATNTGIFGFTKDAPILDEWKWIAEEGWKKSCSRIPDEVGCQMLLHKYKHWLAPVEWGTSVKYGELADKIKIVHYHGRKHVHPFPLCNLWKQEYWELRHSLKGIQQKEFSKPWHDRRLKRYLRETGSNVTTVTAVNAKYLDKLKANFPLWMKVEGIYEHPMVCYVHGVPLDDPKLDFIRNRAQLIEWDFPEAANTRELMLTAFVLGTAKDIKTRWWLKIDADTTPKPEAYKDYTWKLDMPDEAWNNSAFGHKCGYTKSKQCYDNKHFLNTLDDWWEAKTGEEPIFPANIPWREKHGHKRFASYVCLHKSAFVRRCAEMCDGRLPIPSHDTFLWYCAERMKKENWGRTNFKKRFAP
jgi:hypothetical protein